jgi:hypothetical protein
MPNEVLKDLQIAVGNFKEVVDKLAEIKNISENVKASSDNMQKKSKELTDWAGELAISADKVETLCAQIIENNKQNTQLVSGKLSNVQKAILDSNESAVELITMCNDTVITKIAESNERAVKNISDGNEQAVKNISDSNDAVIAKVLDSNEQTAKNISDCVADIRAQVTEYSLSVQKSLDEIRLQNTNNARELRDNISYAKADLAVKADSIQTSVNNLLTKNKSDRTFIMIGTISAVIAAAASIAGLFL